MKTLRDCYQDWPLSLGSSYVEWM